MLVHDRVDVPPEFTVVGFAVRLRVGAAGGGGGVGGGGGAAATLIPTLLEILVPFLPVQVRVKVVLELSGDEVTLTICSYGWPPEGVAPVLFVIVQPVTLYDPKNRVTAWPALMLAEVWPALFTKKSKAGGGHEGAAKTVTGYVLSQLGLGVNQSSSYLTLMLELPGVVAVKVDVLYGPKAGVVNVPRLDPDQLNPPCQ